MQDFYNIDDEKNQTTAGTPQDTDTRWQKMFRRGNEITIWAIEQLRKIAPVEVYYVQGNHDYKMSYFTLEFINAWYRGNANVTVHMSVKPRQYIEFGNCMIGYAHGDKIAKKRLHLMMQAEASEIWGRTKYRELHLGHIHSEQVEELQGYKKRNISSVTAIDKWHSDKAYIGTIRQMQAFVWDFNYGLENIYNITVNQVMEAAA